MTAYLTVEQLLELPADRRDEMSAKAINDLPDSAFAYIEPGGTKDSEGKTVPRSLRHFPVHDEAHTRNALARASQSPFGDKAMPKILAAAKKFGIEVSQDSKPRLPARSRRRASGKPRHRSLPLKPEVRHFRAQGLEVRDDGAASSEIVLSGTPVVYNVPYKVVDMFGPFKETMHAGVAANLLNQDHDVRFLFNHDGLPLARTMAGTLTLKDSSQRLDFEAHLDKRQQLANDLAIAIERRDVSQMSVGFIVAQDEWDFDAEPEETRDIFEWEDLLDVSAVTYPASPTTHIQIAQRMAMEMPVESRARLRYLILETRAGAVLSKSTKEKVKTIQEILDALYEDSGWSPNAVDLAELIDPEQDPDSILAAIEALGDSDDGSVPDEEPRTIKTASELRLRIETGRERKAAA